MRLGTLIIFSGLPGIGKSTIGQGIASRLKATYLRIDTVEQGLRDICGITQIDGKGYELSQRVAADNLRCGNIVIADCVNGEDFTRRDWNSVAHDIGAKFINVHIFCSDIAEHRRRVENRGPSVVGAKSPSWAEVVTRSFDPWIEDHIAIDTSQESFESSVERLLAELTARLDERALD